MKILIVLASLVVLTSQQQNAGGFGGLGIPIGTLNNAFGAVFSNSATQLSNSARPDNVPVAQPFVPPASASPVNVAAPQGQGSNLFSNTFNTLRPGNAFGNAADLFPNANNQRFFVAVRPFRPVRPVAAVPPMPSRRTRSVPVPDMDADEYVLNYYGALFDFFSKARDTNTNNNNDNNKKQ